MIRWVASRKAALLQSIDQGEITAAQACRQYDISPEELASWRRYYRAYGQKALRTTHLQSYRRTPPLRKRHRPL